VSPAREADLARDHGEAVLALHAIHVGQHLRQRAGRHIRQGVAQLRQRAEARPRLGVARLRAVVEDLGADLQLLDGIKHGVSSGWPVPALLGRRIRSHAMRTSRAGGSRVKASFGGTGAPQHPELRV
jgi:hypothetical protein